MSQCMGEIPLTAKIDRPMREFVEEEASRLGVSKSEFVRRLLDVHRASRDGRTPCEHCGASVQLELEAV